MPTGEPTDHALGRSRGGFGTKLIFVSDGRGIPLAVHAVAGQRHESLYAEPTIEDVRITRLEQSDRKWPAALAGDRGLSVPRIRRWLAEREIEDVIPYRSDEVRRMDGEPDFDHETYKQRNAIERLIGWLKEFRRIAMRYEKLALHYLAMVKIAMTRLLMRRYFADTA